MAAQRSSIAVGVSRAGLTLATAFALTRVFAGRSWLLVMVVAAVAPPLFLGWAQRRHWHALARLAVITVGGIWLAALVADPETTVAGVPTRATLSALGHELSRAPHTLRAAVVPVTPIDSALVLAVVGVFVAAALTAWIATSLDAPIGAFAPSIALFIVVGAMGDGAWVAPTALYALAALAYLLALAQHDLLTRRTWFHAARPRGSRIAAGGAAVGAVAIAVSLAVGPSVPGAGGSPLLDYKGFAGNNDSSLLSAPPPILHIQDKLTQRRVQELFTVRSARAAYWRVIALDWFTDDNAWGVNKATEHSASTLSAPDDLPPSKKLQQQFDIKEIDPHWLPAAYRPVEINLTAARVVPDSLTLLVDSPQPIGKVVYDVQSQIPTPSQAVLSRAPLDPEGMPDDIALPAKFPQEVVELAQTITRGATGPYGRAIKLQDFFRKSGKFTYTLDTNLDDSTNAIVQFLKERRGFCEQFAATFAAMARAVDVPTRVAVGYQPGTLGADGLFHVTNRNAHAWPEVYINGAGWIPFEPTPAFREPTLGLGTGGPETPATTPGASSTTTTGSTPPVSQTLPTLQPTRPGGAVNVLPPVKKADHRSVLGTVVTVLLIALAVAALAALVLLATALFAVWRRSYRRRNNTDLRQRVLGAWAEALDVLAAAGIPPRPSATALEFALRHAPAHGAGDAGPALMELARLQSAAMFAPDPPTASEAAEAWEQVDVINASSRRTVTRVARWRRRLRSR
jgi:transglutaminase-like putative cysteine protease